MGSKFWQAISLNSHNHKSGVDIMDNSKKIIAPIDRNEWVWGFTPQAEIWNGRLAMLGFSSVLLIQYLPRLGFLHF
jgi:Chlorophyll A-B binding protein